MAQTQAHFGWWFYRHIAEKYHTVGKAAAEIGCSLATLYRHFRRPDTSELPIGKVAALAEALGMTRDELERRWRNEPVEEPDMAHKGIHARGRMSFVPDPETRSMIERLAAEQGMDIPTVIAYLVKRGLTAPRGEVHGDTEALSAQPPAPQQSVPKTGRGRKAKR